MKKVNFIYRLDGKNIDCGLDVFELAPVLLSLGELIKESNKILNPNGREVAVNIKPFREGSFIVDIVLFAQNNCQGILDLINKDSTKDIKELLEWVGLITGGGGSLFWLIKKLKGKPKTVEQLKPNEIRYTNEEGNAFVVGSRTHQLFSNNNIQKFVYNSYGLPLEGDNVESIDCYLQKEEEETKVTFNKGDVESFRNYSEAEIPSLAVEEEVKTEMEIFVSPKRGSFDADPRQWSFRLGGKGDQIIKATIKDEEFLEKYRENKIRLHFTDVLKIKLIQRVKK